MRVCFQCYSSDISNIAFVYDLKYIRLPYYISLWNEVDFWILNDCMRSGKLKVEFKVEMEAEQLDIKPKFS